MKYILIVLFLILPVALFGGYFAGGIWYARDQGIFHRTHLHSSDAEYFAGLDKSEIAGAVVGSIPGLLILLSTAAADAKERRRAASILLRLTEEDKTTLPPPPDDGSKHG